MKRPSMLVVACAFIMLAVGPVSAQPSAGVNPGFLGTWCVQNDPARRASIVASGLGVRLTNESGSTSDAMSTTGPSTIVALQWDLVNGTLSGDGTRIQWTNDTVWSRCPAPHGRNVDGTWYAGGDRNRPCSIVQEFGTLNFRNETGQLASGAFDGPRHLTATWSGTPIGGTIDKRGTRIDWDNGTFWTR